MSGAASEGASAGWSLALLPAFAVGQARVAVSAPPSEPGPDTLRSLSRLSELVPRWKRNIRNSDTPHLTRCSAGYLIELVGR